MILDFHTHKNHRPPEGMALRNIIIGRDDREIAIHSGEWYSAGIHPWYFTADDAGAKLDALEKLLQHEAVKLLGECGLDRLRGPDLDLQQEIFRAQVKLAGKLNKPVVIHCVRCFSELLFIKKQLQPAVPMIIHGFNSKPETGRQLLKAGFYFSFGAALLNQQSGAARFLKELPADRFFLETDDRDINITEVYQAAAQIIKTTVDELKDTIFANWMSLQSGN